MATLSIQKEPQGKPVAPAAREWWDPFRTMRELLRWDPFGEAAPRWIAEEAAFNAAFDVKETKDAFTFKADLPGMKPEDIDVKINQNRLTVSGKREAEKTDKGDTYYTYERSYGAFTRTFTLPEGVDADKIEANLENGVLTMKLPKKPESQPKQIDVKAK
jgi:HSP20 family protein